MKTDSLAIRELRLSGSKTRSSCSSEARAARFQASLSSTFGRGTMPTKPLLYVGKYIMHLSSFMSSRQINIYFPSDIEIIIINYLN